MAPFKTCITHHKPRAFGAAVGLPVAETSLQERHFSDFFDFVPMNRTSMALSNTFPL